MKINNYVLVLLSLLLSTITIAQTNPLTEIEFNAIRIGKYGINQIDATRGSLAKINAMFGTYSRVSTSSEPSFNKYFVYDGKFHFTFKDVLASSEQEADYDFNTLVINDKSLSITIKGKTVKVGDDIKGLGNVAKTKADRRNAIVFTLGSELVILYYRAFRASDQGYCEGSVRHTTTGSYADKNEANGDCSDTDYAERCGDGTYECSSTGCRPITIPINCPANTTEAECKASPGCTWVATDLVDRITKIEVNRMIL